MIRAYHEAKANGARDEILVPAGCCVTNVAQAALVGYQIREVAIDQNGNLNLHLLKSMAGPRTAALLLSDPLTRDVFESGILEIEKTVHEVGGLLYSDGTILNGLLGYVKPQALGFDVVEIDLQNTFGSGCGACPLAVSDRLRDFLPTPVVTFEKGSYFWISESGPPHTIGQLSAFMGNVGVHYLVPTFASACWVPRGCVAVQILPC